MTFRELIRDAYPDAYRYADGAIVLDRSLQIIFFSDGTATIFGFDVFNAIYSNIGILKIKELSEEFLRKELDYFTDVFATGDKLRVRGRPINGGELLVGYNTRGEIVHVVCGVHPLLLEDIMHLAIFFQHAEKRAEFDHKIALTESKSPFSIKPPDGSIGAQIVSVGDWLINLKGRHKLFLIGTASVVILGIFTWHIDSVSKIIENRKPSPAPSTTPDSYSTEKERVIHFNR